MSQSNFNEIMASEPQARMILICATGNNTGTPTKNFGNGVTVTRTGVGVWRLAFSDFNGKSLGVYGYSLTDATMANVKGFTVTFAPWASATNSIDLSIWNSTFAAAELLSTMVLCVWVAFKVTSA